MPERTTTPAHSLVALIVAQHEALVERLAHEAITGEGARTRPAGESSYYAGIPRERLREGIVATLAAITRDLEEGVCDRHYAQRMGLISVSRVRGGITLRDVRAVMDDVSRLLRDLCRQLDPSEQIQALEMVSLIMEASWFSAFSCFSDAIRVVLEDAHRDVVRELSAPIIPIHAGVLVLPLIGRIDRERGELLTATLLPAIAREQAFGVLLDITGVPTLDAEVAGWLVRITRAARLLGAEVLLVGISPEIAGTMVSAGLDLRGLVAFGTLQAGLEFVLARRGLVITRRGSGPARV